MRSEGKEEESDTLEDVQETNENDSGSVSQGQSASVISEDVT